MSDDIQEQKQLAEQQTELGKEQTAHSTGMQIAAESHREKVENPDFLGKLQEPDIDTDLFDWLHDEIGPVASGAHILGNRAEYYEEYATLKNQNKAERLVAEREPGRLLKQNPAMLAQSQGVTGWAQGEGPASQPDYRAPLTSKKKRALRDAMEVLTNRQTMSIDARGLDAVSTVTVENKRVDSESQEASGAVSKAKEFFK